LQPNTCTVYPKGINTKYAVESAFSALENASIRTVGPELIFGKIYDKIGFGAIKEPLFRHLVIARLAFPLSKLKTCEYLYRYQGVRLGIDTVYRFLDRLNAKLKPQIEQITFAHVKKKLNDQINVVFYDLTTLYFEASDEDDLRKTGFSKDGKHGCPQIYIGLLVTLGGYAIGYDIFEGNIYEGHTLIPFLENISRKFSLNTAYFVHSTSKPVIIADAGLLSKENITELGKNQYQYIIGARIKNESHQLKSDILSNVFTENTVKSFKKGETNRLIVSYRVLCTQYKYSEKRAKKDAYNRKRGLNRLEKQVKSGKLTKASINNRGYNK